MFKSVSTMNHMFGNPKGDPDNINYTKLTNQASNIFDEYQELQEAINAKDVTAIRDALCDIMVFALGAYHFIGYDADKDMDVVYQSNMSKFCTNEDELERTKQHYNFLGVKTYTGGTFPCAWVKSARQQTGEDGKNYPEGKFLKNVNWKEPKFE